MLTTLETMLTLDRIQNPPPRRESFEDHLGPDTTTVDEDAYQAAVDTWTEANQERLDQLHALDEAEELPASPKLAILAALQAKSREIAAANDTLSQLLAVAVHGAGISLRGAASATGLHHRTVEKRASQADALEAVIEFKKRELDHLNSRTPQS